MANIAAFLDKDYENKEFSELIKAPVSALQGVSESDAKKLEEAFGIKTIGDLGTNKYFHWAFAMVTLSQKKKLIEL